MQSTLLPTILLTLLAVPTLATINKGVAYYTDGHSDQAVWIDGDDACDYVYMGPSNDNICTYNSGWFTAQNTYEYRFTGCGGGNFCLLNSDSSLNSCGHYAPQSRAGNGCYGNAGSFYVDREWQFY